MKAKGMKLAKETGSFFNYLMSNNNSIPEVGKGATILHWTDRSAYEVLEIEKEGKRVKIQKYNPERVDNYGMSECQIYKYEKFEGEPIWIEFRNGSWKEEHNVVRFTKEFLKSRNAENKIVSSVLTDEEAELIYEGDVYPKNVIKGITVSKKEYSRINIIFGVKQEYYDYSF